jgi:hypothetical protein
VAVKKNNFATGPHGTAVTLTNSDDVPGNDAFGQGVKSTGCTANYYSTATLDRPTAQYVMEVICPSGGGTVYMGWDSVTWPAGSSSNQIWARFYARIPVRPVTSTGYTDMAQFLAFDETNGVPFSYLHVAIASAASGEMFATNGTSSVTGSIPVVQGQWFRVEVRAQFSTTSTGNGALRYYEQADAPLTDYTEEITWTGWDEPGASVVDQAIFGYFAGATLASGITMYMSGIELNTVDWPGPAPFRPGKGVPGILSSPVAIHSDVR